MPFVKFSCIGKASVSVPATPGDVDEFTAGEEGRPAIRKKGASINNVIDIRADTAAKAGKVWSLPRFLSVRAKLKKNILPLDTLAKKFSVEYWTLPGSNLPRRP